MLNYRMDFHSADEIAARDPFAGAGVFLPFDFPDTAVILAAVKDVFGTIPAVAFPSRGAWADLSDADLGRGEAMTRWSHRGTLQ
jgi:hypothetical protein